MMYDSFKDCKFITFDNEQASPTDSEVDYDGIYDACYYGTYNAMQDFFHINGNDFELNNNIGTSSDALEFSTSTDARLYTVSVASAPTSSAQATEAYMLDTRNILIIIGLTWLAITLYSKLKNLIINYTR